MIRSLLVALALAAAPASSETPRLRHDATVVWRESHPAFGGFSGLEILGGGSRFVAVTDRGHWATGRLLREGGAIVGVEMTGLGPLRAISGQRLVGDEVDAEDIAVDSQGRFFVAFEHFHRIRRYDAIEGAAADVPSHPGFARLQRNSGIEALAIDADDVLYAIPERSGALDRPFPVFRLRGDVWDTKLSLPREGAFLPTGADFGPDGRLYLVERDFSFLGGFRTRVRRFALGPQGFHGGETLLETGWGELDNMEGIAVWADAAGAIRVTLLSDDNFFPLQRTIFAEYIVEADRLAGAPADAR